MCILMVEGVVVAQQSVYYFSQRDFDVVIDKLYQAMNPGAVIYASMMGTQHTYYSHSSATDDESLRRISFSGRRFTMDDYYVNFVDSREVLLDRFKAFVPIEVGSYMLQLEANETNNWHWTFIGKKSAD